MKSDKQTEMEFLTLLENDARLTPEQLAVMLWRSAGCPASAHSLASFADAGQISGYALEAMRWVTAKEAETMPFCPADQEIIERLK